MDNGTDTQPFSEILLKSVRTSMTAAIPPGAIGFGIVTEGQTLKELRYNVMEAIDCYIDNPEDHPCSVLFHYVRDDLIAV